MIHDRVHRVAAHLTPHSSSVRMGIVAVQAAVFCGVCYSIVQAIADHGDDHGSDRTAMNSIYGIQSLKSLRTATVE